MNGRRLSCMVLLLAAVGLTIACGSSNPPASSPSPSGTEPASPSKPETGPGSGKGDGPGNRDGAGPGPSNHSGPHKDGGT